MENEDFIQQLIETKSFDTLTKNERESVLLIMSKEEYTSRYEIVEQSKDLLNAGVRSMVPSPTIKSNVAELMEQRKQEEGTSFWGMLNRVVAIKIPAYQFVLALALVIFLLPTLSKKEVNELASTAPIEKEIAYITDTVFIEKEVPTPVELEKIKYIKVKQKEEASISDAIDAMTFFENQSINNNENTNNLQSAKKQFEEQLNNIGQSSMDREELHQFNVVVQ